jgi:hypothetical protein
LPALLGPEAEHRLPDLEADVTHGPVPSYDLRVLDYCGVIDHWLAELERGLTAR